MCEVKLHTKIKLFSTFCKKPEEVEKEVNDFCRNRIIVDIKMEDTRIMVIYSGGSDDVEN